MMPFLGQHCEMSCIAGNAAPGSSNCPREEVGVLMGTCERHCQAHRLLVCYHFTA